MHAVVEVCSSAKVRTHSCLILSQACDILNLDICERMPQTTVFFFQEPEGTSSVLELLLWLRKDKRKAFVKCLARIRRLEAMGHELLRPEADFLRNGIDELRARL